jgi:protein SMG6
MAVATMVTGSQAHGPEELMAAAVSAVLSASPSPLVLSSSADHLSNMFVKLSLASDKPVAGIDDFPSPSIGLAAAKLLDVKLEKERLV